MASLDREIATANFDVSLGQCQTVDAMVPVVVPAAGGAERLGLLASVPYMKSPATPVPTRVAAERLFQVQPLLVQVHPSGTSLKLSSSPGTLRAV